MFNYKNSQVITGNFNGSVFINFIVPIRNRKRFVDINYQSFKKSALLFYKKHNLKIVYTLVEHDETSQFVEYAKNKKINYVFIKSGEEFNKCLACNAGVILTNVAKYYIFHDVDCIFSEDFFENIYKNLLNKKTKALQCFQKRRVLYCDFDITNNLIEGKVDIRNIIKGQHKKNIREGHEGAPGGSILVERQLFLDVGGYDDHLFSGYAPEDKYFWEKLLAVYERIDSADNPIVDLYHLHHKSLARNVKEFNEAYESFLRLSKEQKLKKIQKLSEDFKNIIKHYRT